MLAPICLFAYDRPEHLKQTIKYLSENDLAKESSLFIFCDGPKSKQNQDKTKEVRAIANSTKGFRTVQVTMRDTNKGLANSIIEGVTKIVNKFGKVIVLEDDMITSPYFLSYCNQALDLYEDEKEVASIHGYLYPLKQDIKETFFLRGTDCWGWATWKDRWADFNPSGKDLKNKLDQRGLKRLFDYNDNYPFYQMLVDQIEGKNNSWAIRWHATMFLKNKLTLYPQKSLIQNIGLDSSGTHCVETNHFDVLVQKRPVNLKKIEISESIDRRKDFEKYFHKITKRSFKRIFKRMIGLLRI